MKKNGFYLTLIFGLTMVAVFFWDAPPAILSSGTQSEDVSERTPYAIIENAQTQHYDDSGDLSYQFVAKTLRHFRLNLAQISEGDYTTLDAPMLTLYTQDGPWFITADSGKATENGEILTLWKNVRIWQSNNSEQQTTELTTEQLIIEPLKKIVRTRSKVNINSAQGHLEALGMNINLISKQIKLLNQVRGRHEPI